MPTDIESILDHYGVDYDGSKSGNQAIKCPVHEDSHASASLNLTKEVFNCHACGVGGGAVEIVMSREGQPFETAVRTTEAITGVRYSSGGSESRTRAAVPPGSGYRPRNRKKVSTRSRQRLQF